MPCVPPAAQIAAEAATAEANAAEAAATKASREARAAEYARQRSEEAPANAVAARQEAGRFMRVKLWCDSRIVGQRISLQHVWADTSREKYCLCSIAQPRHVRHGKGGGVTRGSVGRDAVQKRSSSEWR